MPTNVVTGRLLLTVLANESFERMQEVREERRKAWWKSVCGRCLLKGGVEYRCGVLSRRIDYPGVPCKNNSKRRKREDDMHFHIPIIDQGSSESSIFDRSIFLCFHIRTKGLHTLRSTY